MGELPRQKLQYSLRRRYPRHEWVIEKGETINKIILIIKNNFDRVIHRGFIYQNKARSLFVGKEQLCANFFIKDQKGEW